VYVAEIWRYPVKSMSGESLTQVTLTTSGLEGDRLIQVFDVNGRLVTARTRPRLLRHHATVAPSGDILIDGRHWTDPDVLEDVRRAAGPGAHLVRNDDPDVRFDILPLLVATDGAIAAFGRDRRRLRPNIVIGGVAGLDERRWPGRTLHIGEVAIDIDSLRGRCVMTTFDPDTQEQDAGVLRDIVRRFDGRLALNAGVIRGGTITIGQKVTVVEPVAAAESLSQIAD
jgi:hypothetical protein